MYASLACLWEVTARKAGNVHRFADFEDLTYLDFLHSAAALRGIFAPGQPVGETVHRAVEATRQVVRTNTNLGMILLFAPLAAVPDRVDLRRGVAKVLEKLTVEDSRHVFAAIRLAQPGGMGEAPEQDLRDEPTLPLQQIMAFAQDRDLIARQYANGFREIFDDGLPFLVGQLSRLPGRPLEPAVVETHLHFVANYPDSLIQRKRGLAVAEEASRRARIVIETPADLRQAAFRDFDSWLRADGHARNPGTSADLTAACLFAALRAGIITVPLNVPWNGPPHA